MKTSATDPIRVDFLPGDAHGLAGRVGMTIAPGKKHHGLTGGWQRDLETDLLRLREVYRCDLLVTLLEKHELDRFHVPNLLDLTRTHGMESAWAPIRDGGVPKAMDSFRELISRIVAGATAGRTVVIHCRGGLGRTGLVAASFLVALGRSPAEAMSIVRQARPGTVETGEQELYIRRFETAWRRHGRR